MNIDVGQILIITWEEGDTVSILQRGEVRF